MTGTQKLVLGLAGLLVVFCLGCLGCATLGSLAGKEQPTAAAGPPVAATTAPTAAPVLTPTAPRPTQPPPAAATPAPPAPPPPTATRSAAPPPPPTATRAPAPPPGSDLNALIAYGQALKPILDEAQAIVERDSAILKASENNNDAVLCDGRLTADVAPMKALVSRARAIRPPAQAAAIHQLVVESGESWAKALEHVDSFCRTRNGLYKAGAVVEFGKAALQLRDAATRFYWLLAAKGIEEWVQ